MICSVRWLDTESYTVRLLRGSLDDGMTNGNSAPPAVSTTPVTAAEERTNASIARRRAAARRASSAAAIAASGTTTGHGDSGWATSQLPGPCATVFASGMNGEFAGG